MPPRRRDPVRARRTSGLTRLVGTGARQPSEGEPELTGIELVAKIWDERDDPEGIVFEEETLLEGQAKFNKFVASQEERFQTRLHRLGFVRQPAPTVKE